MSAVHITRSIYRDQLTEKAKKQREKQHNGRNNRLAWTYLCNQFNEKPKAVRTYASLFGASEDYTYFTPNTFYRNDRRNASTLRWINAMSVDIDVKNGQNEGLIFPDVQDLITEAGLPMPSLVVQTPSGGFHVHWFLDAPKRASKKLLPHYTRIQKRIALAIQGDVQATGAERWFRLPKEDNLVYQSDMRTSFDALCDWFQITQEQDCADAREYKKGICVGAESIVHHAAIRKILAGVTEGFRDNACYTLALTFKAAGYDEATAERLLHDWNQKNTPSMRQIDIKRKVKSAYKGNKKAPSASWIRYLSGMNFTYVKWEEAKPRHERTYSHANEWEEDVLAYIRSRGGAVCGSQRLFAEQITSSVDRTKTIPYTTLKRIIKRLEERGEIAKLVEGKGRSSITTLTITNELKAARRASDASKRQKKETAKLNESNSNTIKDSAVGGIALPLPLVPGPSVSPIAQPLDISYTSSSPAPIPRNVPAAFVSALWNRGFRDGRFFFRAWGKIQLAFKSLGISYSCIPAVSNYLTLAVEAVSLTVAKKGSMVAGTFHDADDFLKYLYGTSKGLLANYRADELTRFVDQVESLGDTALLCYEVHLRDQLEDKSVLDRQLVVDKLQAVGEEKAARERRKVWKETFGKVTLLDKFSMWLKQD